MTDDKAPRQSEASGPKRALYMTNRNQGAVTRQIAQLVLDLGAGGIIEVRECPKLTEALARIEELEAAIKGELFKGTGLQAKLKGQE